MAKLIILDYTLVLFDSNCDIFSEKIYFIRIKKWNFSSIQVFRMSNDFLERGVGNNRAQVSKFNYRVKTIYIP